MKLFHVENALMFRAPARPGLGVFVGVLLGPCNATVDLSVGMEPPVDVRDPFRVFLLGAGL